ncbi:MAG: DMT family transporter [Clostridia bacterium]|nr:DMT family transporter [Clostridia bacterium]
MSSKWRANILLFATALIWGFGFVAMDQGAEVLEPVSFNALRMALAALSILPLVLWIDHKGQGVRWKSMNLHQKKTLLCGGFWCGVMLAMGAVIQQFALEQGIEVGKAGFIAALYIIFVPLSGVFRRKKLSVLVWIAVVFSTIGLYFLCIQGGFSLAPADSLMIVSSMFYAGHILVIDHYSQRTDCVKMSLIQFITTALICGVISAVTEHTTWQAVQAGALPLLYVGVLGSGVAYTMQILGQKDANPTVSSLILSLESVFAVLAGWVLLGDMLSGRELFGCVMMMTGIVLAQLPQPKEN